MNPATVPPHEGDSLCRMRAPRAGFGLRRRPSVVPGAGSGHARAAPARASCGPGGDRASAFREPRRGRGGSGPPVASRLLRQGPQRERRARTDDGGLLVARRTRRGRSRRSTSSTSTGSTKPRRVACATRRSQSSSPRPAAKGRGAGHVRAEVRTAGYSSPFVFRRGSFSLMNARMSSAMSSSFAHCSL